MTVRPARKTDIPQMMALAEQSPMAAHWTESDYARMFVSYPDEGANNTAPRRVALSIENSEQKFSGFIVAHVIANEEEWEIENVVIAPGEQRSGLAMQLMSGLIEIAKREKARCIWLEVRSSNRPAIALYCKSGFKEKGRRKNYYSSPTEDAVIFSLDLAPAT